MTPAKKTAPPPAPKPRRLQYVGGIDAIYVTLPSGRRFEVARGEVLEGLLPNEWAALSVRPDFTVPTEEDS